MTAASGTSEPAHDPLSIGKNAAAAESARTAIGKSLESLKDASEGEKDSVELQMFVAELEDVYTRFAGWVASRYL